MLGACGGNPCEHKTSQNVLVYCQVAVSKQGLLVCTIGPVVGSSAPGLLPSSSAHHPHAPQPGREVLVISKT